MDFIEKNATIFAELIQYLDDKSLLLVIRDVRDNGRKALTILREHYLSKRKAESYFPLCRVSIFEKIEIRVYYRFHSKGHLCRYILKNALCIATFKQKIFSVQATTRNGVYISIKQDNSQSIYPNGAVFNITQRGHLNYLKNIVSA